MTLMEFIQGILDAIFGYKKPQATQPAPTTPANTTPVKPLLTGQAYCDEKYPGTTYNAARNTCVRPATATTPATSTPVQGAVQQADSFNSWYAAFLTKNGINHATVNSIDASPDGSQIMVQFMDGSRKWYPNPQAIPLSTATPETPRCKADIPWERPYTDLHRNEQGILMDKYGITYVASYNVGSGQEIHYVVEDNQATNTRYYSLPDTCPTPAAPVPAAPPASTQPYVPPNPVNTTVPAAPMANKDCEVEALNTSPAVGPAGGAKGSPAYYARIAWCRQAGGYN